MQFKKVIPEGGEVPKWYGIAWRANYRFEIVCYPIPLNIIIRVYLHCYYALKFGLFKSKYEADLLKARLEGIRKE